MLGIMEKDTEAKPIGQPREDVPQMKPMEGPAKVKSSTITMFFKSPPKEPVKPIVKSPDITGYFKPISNSNAQNSHPGAAIEADKGDVKVADVTNEDVKKQGRSQTKHAADKRTKKDAMCSGNKQKGNDNKKASEGVSESKSRPKTKSTSKVRSKSSVGNGDEKNGEKSTINASITKQTCDVKTEKKGSVKEADLSLEDFDTSKPEKSTKVKTKTSKQRKSSQKKLVLKDDPKESMLQVSKDGVPLNCHKDAKVSNNKDIPGPVSESKSTSIISYKDYLGTEGVEEGTDDQVVPQSTEDDSNTEDAVPQSTEDDSNTEDANSSVVISYAEFLTQVSQEEVKENDNIKHARNDNENNHLSRELSDVDMADAVTEESVMSMDTGTTSDEDVFKDEDDLSQTSGSQDVSGHSSSDAVMTVSLDATPKLSTSTQKIQTSKSKYTESLKKKEKVKVASTDETSERCLKEAETEDDDDAAMCLPKRKEVKVTVQVHTIPMIAPVVSPSTSPGQSPGTGKVKSNVVVDAADLDLEVIHVEATDVDNKYQSENVFNFSGGSTPKRDTSSDTSIKPAPTKMYSIFQKKSSVKDSSKLPNKNVKESTEKGNKTQKTSKEDRETSDQSSVGSRQTIPATTKPVKEVTSSQPETKETESKQRVDIDVQKDKSDVNQGKKSKLSLGKKKEEPDKAPESKCRRSSGRAAAIKARKDILEQELKQEMAGSESVTSQEEIQPPKKRTLKELFPSATDTDASEWESKQLQNSSKKKGKQMKLKQGKILTKQKAVSDDSKVEEKQNPKSPGVGRRKVTKRKSSSEAGDTSDEGIVKRKRGRPSKGEAAEKVGKLRKGPVMTSSPKPNKNSVKKAKARELLQKAKTRQASSKASPSKPKKSRTKSQDSIVVLDSSTEENPTQTKTLRNFKDVLGKKVVAKELDVKKKGATKEKEQKKSEKGKPVELDKKKHEKSKAPADKKTELASEGKVPTKICPLFTKEGRLAASKKQAEMIEANARAQMSSPDPVIILSDEDSCDTRMSQGGGTSSGPISFSGILGSLKRSEQEKAVQELPYPPFPSVSHVLQQEKENSQYWNLPRPNLPSLSKEIPTLPPTVLPLTNLNLNLGMVTLCGAEKTRSDFDNLKEFRGHEEFTYETQRVLLEDIGKCNPKVQVRKLFKRYLAKRKGDSPPPSKSATDQPSDKSNDKFTKLKAGQPSSGKRKSEAIVDESESTGRRKRSRKDPEIEEKEVRSTRLRRSSRSQQQQEEPKELRRSKRRSTLGKEETKEVKGLEKSKVKVTDDKAPSEVKEKDEATLKAEKLASMMWTEKYQPTCAVEVMGNTTCVKKLSGWLNEWRKKFLKEKKKMKKQQMKGAAKKQEDKDAADSDSDFEMGDGISDSDSDYSDDEDFLCNTMLISGPSGAGKTAAVYACAQEHGFKVFEVNASSRRVGRQILAELGEATQSHHVAARPGAKTSINSFFTPGSRMSPGKSPSKSPARRKKAAEQKKKPPIPKAFANFFKTAGASGDDKKTTKDSPKTKPKNQPGKKKKGKEEPPAVTLTTKKKTEAPSEKTIPSTSIILFEEVDVVFEEDKGFLAAIASFMETTKRPIILTASDPQFVSTFEGHYESLIFKRPSPTLLATHLQLVALAENVFTKTQDMKSVAEHLECDIRQSVLAIQYWISSGAKRTCSATSGSKPVARVMDQSNTCKINKIVKKSEKNGANVSEQNSADPSRTDNSVKKLVNLESKINVIGEYYGKKKERGPSLEATYHEVIQGETGRHDVCLECIMGVCNQTGTEKEMEHIFQLPESTSSLSTRSSVAEMYQHLFQSEVTYNNFHYLLQQPCEELPQCNPSSCSPSSLGKKLVSNTAKYLDHLSFMDATFSSVHDGMPKLSSCHSNQGWWQADLKASMLDLGGEEEQASYHENSLQSEIRAHLEILSFGTCRRKYQRLLRGSGVVRGKAGDVVAEKAGAETVASPKKSSEDDEKANEREDIWPCVDSTFRLRAQETKCPEVYPVVAHRLPYHVYCSHETMGCDYLPAIRQICRSERWRKEAQLKRRFLHYLDYNTMNLKATDYLKLASALDVHPNKPPQEDSFLSAI